MPTTASSNHPHVRLTRDAHEKIRLIAHYEQKSQGQIIEEMADQWIDREGIPVVVLVPRQRPPEEIARDIAKKKAETTKKASETRKSKKQGVETPLPPPTRTKVAVEGEKRPAPRTRRHSAAPHSARMRSSR